MCRCWPSWASWTCPRSRAAADALVEGVAGARRIDVPGVAHLPSLERPEWFTETLLAFLAETA